MGRSTMLSEGLLCVLHTWPFLLQSPFNLTGCNSLASNTYEHLLLPDTAM